MGFEPTVPETGTPVFETGPFNHSGTPPGILGDQYTTAAAVAEELSQEQSALFGQEAPPDLGPDYYDRQRDTRRQIAHHVGKLGSLGFEVTLCRIPEPDPDGTDPAQAA